MHLHFADYFICLIGTEQPLFYENFDVSNLVTPVDWRALQKLLEQANYDKSEKEFLVNGFKNGFPIGYEGNRDVRQVSRNLPFTIGDKITLWNKVMKEVKEGRYAGPFKTIPFQSYIQSPIGLVPKDGGKATRLIFHLSYPRLPKEAEQKSVNANTPRDKCTVQ